MLAKALPERFVIVDGMAEIETVEENLWKALRKRVI